MLGLTSVTFRKLSRVQVVQLAARAGADAVEWGTDVHVTDLNAAADARALCAGEGIAVNSMGSYYRPGTDTGDFEKVCELACTLGAHIIRVWCGSSGSRGTGAQTLSQLVEQVHTMCKTARSYEQTVAFEFHKGTFNDRGASWRRFSDLANEPNLKTYWQPMFAGRDEANLREVMADTVVVHMFNWNRLGVKYPLEDGIKKLSQFFYILGRGQYKGDILLEFVKGDSPEQFLEDYKALKVLAGGVGM